MITTKEGYQIVLHSDGYHIFEKGLDYGVGYDSVDQAYATLRKILWFEETINNRQETNQMQPTMTELLMKKRITKAAWWQKLCAVGGSICLLAGTVASWYWFVVPHIWH